MTVTRFAPSPTGSLHLGHAVSAVLAHAFARGEGGRFLVRIEDIDGARSRAAHVDAILADLDWLGLSPDAPPLIQSRRLPLYAAALDRLRGEKLLYPCFCTRADIAASASAPHGLAPIYPGTCRRLGAAERRERLLTQTHAWRLDMAAAVATAGPLMFTDRGAAIAADPAAAGDVVLARKDAPASYHLAATVDDAASGVTDVVRGADLLDATHVHRLLQALLGLPTPAYHHHPLLTGVDGRRLAKRDGAPSLAEMRARGADPAALREWVIDWAARLGFDVAAP